MSSAAAPTASASAPAVPEVPEVDPAVAAARARTTDALLHTAQVLDQVAEAHARSARGVREGWRGPHRSRFDAERACRDAELAGLAVACRQLAAR